MNEESEHKQKIDDFLLGQMKEEEVAAFQKQLKDDPALQKEVALQEKIIEGVKAFSNQALKARLKEIHQEAVKPPGKRIPMRPIWSYIAIAASVLLVGVIAIWLFQPKQPQDLFEAYYAPYHFNAGTRNATDRILAEANELYQQGQFREALPKLDSLSQDHPDSLEYLLAQGICYVEIGQSDQARQVFQRIIQSGNALFIDQAQWYQALLLIKENQPDQARALLDGLAQNTEADHHQEARRLLKALDK